MHKQPIKILDVHFSPERLITLDVPGPRGYKAGGRRGPVLTRNEAVDDPSALYTAFGGTSGAAALVAGLISLIQRKNSTRLNGVDVKNKLTAAPNPNLDVSSWYWLDGRTLLKGDAVNGVRNPDSKALFGKGGLVHATTLLGITWPP